MRLFNKILCPVDFSENSTKALQWTEFLANKFGSQVVVLHVTDFYPANAFLDVDYDTYHAAIANSMKEFLAPLRVKYESMLSSGDAAQKIVALATGLEATVIVMGTAGLTGAAHKLLGSTTESVVRTSNIPVLTVSPSVHAPELSTNRTLVPISRIDQPPRGYVRLRRILRELEADSTLMHVVEMNDNMFNGNFYANPFLMTNVEVGEKNHQLTRIGTKILAAPGAESIIQFGDVAREILKEISIDRYDFVLLGPRKKTFLSRFVESTAYKIISHSSVPVITIRVA